MHLQVRDGFLHLEGILSKLLFDLFCLDPHLEHFINDLLEVFDKVVILRLYVFVGLVDDVDKDLPVVLQCTAQSFQVVVHLNEVKRGTLTSSEN